MIQNSDIIKYRLTVEDHNEICGHVARIYCESTLRGLNAATTYVRTTQQIIDQHYTGFGAELAWARINNTPWRKPINEFHNIPDDGTHEIRSSKRSNAGLIIRDNDPPDRKYVFAILKGTTYWFYGWAYGHEAIKDEYYYNPHNWRPAHSMPKEHLRPLSTLSSSNIS
jgi:RNA-splicing ligase RtcB